MLICTSCQPRALWNAWHDPPLFQAPPPSHVSAPHVRAPPQVGMTRCMGADGVGGCHIYPSPPPTYTPRIKLIHSEDHIYEGTSGLCSRVSHFYTFFELSLVLLTTHAKSAHFRTKKMALRVAKSKF